MAKGISRDFQCYYKNNGGPGVAELAIADLILTRAREKKLGVEITWGEGY
jgi:hypothetical protein